MQSDQRLSCLHKKEGLIALRQFHLFTVRNSVTMSKMLSCFEMVFIMSEDVRIVAKLTVNKMLRRLARSLDFS